MSVYCVQIAEIVVVPILFHLDFINAVALGVHAFCVLSACSTVGDRAARQLQLGATGVLQGLNAGFGICNSLIACVQVDVTTEGGYVTTLNQTAVNGGNSSAVGINAAAVFSRNRSRPKPAKKK